MDQHGFRASAAVVFQLEDQWFDPKPPALCVKMSLGKAFNLNFGPVMLSGSDCIK